MGLWPTHRDENANECGKVDTGGERKRSRPLWMS